MCVHAFVCVGSRNFVKGLIVNSLAFVSYVAFVTVIQFCPFRKLISDIQYVKRTVRSVLQ